MGKEDGVVAVAITRTVEDEDIVVVVDDIVVVGAGIISDHAMAKLMYINKNNKATVWG